MTKLIAIVAMMSLFSGCTNTKDLATTLRYADNTPIGVNKIKFIELENMKRGKACTLNFLYYIPIYGDGSILTAADNGHINTVELIGETGHWYFPFSTDCTVVFGDKSAILENQEPKTN
jgi:TRL-like protein family